MFVEPHGGGPLARHTKGPADLHPPIPRVHTPALREFPGQLLGIRPHAADASASGPGGHKTGRVHEEPSLLRLSPVPGGLADINPRGEMRLQPARLRQPQTVLTKPLCRGSPLVLSRYGPPPEHFREERSVRQLLQSRQIGAVPLQKRRATSPGTEMPPDDARGLEVSNYAVFPSVEEGVASGHRPQEEGLGQHATTGGGDIHALQSREQLPASQHQDSHLALALAWFE